MPDITMCTGDCPIREECYRYTAEPNRFGQSYSNLESICIPDNFAEFIPDNRQIKKEENEIDYTIDNFIMDESKKALDKLIKYIKEEKI